MSDDLSRKHPRQNDPELDGPENDAVEADAATAAAANDTFEQAADGPSGLKIEKIDAAEEEEPAPEPVAKLERLQKILAQAGVASRRHAEELITEGRVQVNGKVVTELGTKADPARDHIRVDGKLLQGSERHRYYMLNKPKGFVTTVSDPEGRPTIMQFFSKMRERLYPVGRLDYLSEGLLLVTNDGELANKLTRAALGVEKTYLVKVSGQPSEEDLDRLREGVPIDRGKPGSGRVQTAPAQIRRFNPGKRGNQRPGPGTGENPWFEVVIIEGRNRELRKMFEEIGHHVEKIRRVGYGPLVLDIEPGKVRELEPAEVENLRKAAEGKYQKPKAREPRRQGAPPRADHRPAQTRWNQARGGRPDHRNREEQRDRGPARGFERPPATGRSRNADRGEFRGRPRNDFRPGNQLGEDRPQRPPRRDSRPSAGPGEQRRKFDKERPQERSERPQRFGSRPPRREFGPPRDIQAEHPENRHRFERGPQARPGGPRPFRRDRDDRAGSDRPRREAPAGRQGREDRPERPSFRERRSEPRQGQGPSRQGQRSNERPSGSRPGGFKASKPGFGSGKSGSGRSGAGRRPGAGGRPGGKPGGGRPGGRSGGSGRPGGRPGGKRRP